MFIAGRGHGSTRCRWSSVLPVFESSWSRGIRCGNLLLYDAMQSVAYIRLCMTRGEYCMVAAQSACGALSKSDLRCGTAIEDDCLWYGPWYCFSPASRCTSRVGLIVSRLPLYICTMRASASEVGRCTFLVPCTTLFIIHFAI